jgi:Methyltransferase domain
VPPGHGLGTTTISWTTGTELSAEVYVSRNDEPETLFARGRVGKRDASWIAAGSTYRFRLVGVGDAEDELAEVIVSQEAVPWEIVVEGLEVHAGDEERREEFAALLARHVSRFAFPPFYQQHFRIFEQYGVHVTPVHFYSPVPDTRTIGDEIFGQASPLDGIDMNEKGQLLLVREVFPQFRDEYEQFSHDPTDCPYDYYFNNPQFGGTDGVTLYCMVRHLKPRLVVEVGSGYSSMVTAAAARRNKTTQLVCIEPFPPPILREGFPGLTTLIAEEAQNIEVSFFEQLERDDILFIDTSHVVKTGGEVNYLFLDVLPRIKPGVVVQVHDIFFPLEYPRHWVLEMLRFYNEQYLLQAFLAFNSEFEVVLSSSYLAYKHKEELKRTFPNSPWWGGTSLWMRRRG